MQIVTPKRVAIFASLLGTFVMIVLLVMLKARNNNAVGFVVSETGAEKAGLTGLFIGIAVLIGILVFITVLHRQNRRYY